MENIIAEILLKYKGKKIADTLAKEVATAIVAALPKASPMMGKKSNPDYTGEDGVTYTWCARHQMYHDIRVMRVTPAGVSKGYCLASEAKWNKAYSTQKYYRELELSLRRKLKFVGAAEAEEISAKANAAEAAAASAMDCTTKYAADYYNYKEDFIVWSSPKVKSWISAGMPELPADIKIEKGGEDK